MYVKVFLLVVVVHVARQGLATPLLQQHEDSNRSNYHISSPLKMLDTASDTTASSSNTLLRLFGNCKNIFFDIISDFGRSLQLVTGFSSEARQYYKWYKDCDQVENNPAAVKICKEATKFAYFDAVKTRFNNFGKSFKGVVFNILKIPFCAFIRN